MTTYEWEKWGFTFVFSDISSPPLCYPSALLRPGIMGIIALGTLHLPEIGGSGSRTIDSGSVVYFRLISRIEHCNSKGRGIMFCINC